MQVDKWYDKYIFKYGHIKDIATMIKALCAYSGSINILRSLALYGPLNGGQPTEATLGYLQHNVGNILNTVDTRLLKALQRAHPELDLNLHSISSRHPGIYTLVSFDPDFPFEEGAGRTNEGDFDDE